MVRQVTIWRWLVIGIALCSASGPVYSQTNVAAKIAPPAAAKSDPDKFFAQYREAVTFVSKNRRQDAAIIMDVLSRNLSTSPWMEIAVLKHSQLIETRNDQVAMDNYLLLKLRLAQAPYFQGNEERAKVFSAALKGAVETGINRVRVMRVRDALDRYRIRYHEYPETLAKLPIFGYTDIENIHAANNQLLRYVPTGQRMTPFISNQQYELQSFAIEPFSVTSPRLEGITMVRNNPPKYAGLMRVGGRSEPETIEEDRTIQGFLVAAVWEGGAILCNNTRILVLLTPQ